MPPDYRSSLLRLPAIGDCRLVRRKAEMWLDRTVCQVSRTSGSRRLGCLDHDCFEVVGSIADGHLAHFLVCQIWIVALVNLAATYRSKACFDQQSLEGWLVKNELMTPIAHEVVEDHAWGERRRILDLGRNVLQCPFGILDDVEGIRIGQEPA